jgi:hypothetical protein
MEIAGHEYESFVQERLISIQRGKGREYREGNRDSLHKLDTSHLHIFVPAINSCVEILIRSLSEKSSTKNRVQALNMDEVFMLATLDIIGQTMFSLDLQACTFSLFLLVFFIFLIFF